MPSATSLKRCRRQTSASTMSMFGLQKESPTQIERSVNLWRATSRCTSLRSGLAWLWRCGWRRARFRCRLLHPRINLGVDLGDVALQGRPHVADGLCQGGPRVGNLLGGPGDLLGGGAAILLQCGDFRFDASQREEEQEVQGEEYDYEPPEHVPRPHVLGNDLQDGAGEVRRLGCELLSLVCKVVLRHRRSSRRIFSRKANIDHSIQKLALANRQCVQDIALRVEFGTTRRF